MAVNSASIVWVVIIGACFGVYYLYRQGKIPWLKGIKMPKMFEPKPEDQVEKLKIQTGKEMERAKELRKVLEAKTELAKAKAESIRLQKEIDGVSERSVEKGRRDAEKEEQEAKNKKPRRL